MKNTVIGYVNDYAICMGEEHDTIYLAEVKKGIFDIGTMADEELLIPIDEIQDDALVETVELFLKKERK